MTDRVKIEPGFQLGNLTVVSATDRRKNGYTIWQYKCDCGNTIELDTRTLQRGTVRDCGCRTKVNPGQWDITGQRFGRLVAIESTQERNASGSTVWRCRCDCGSEVLTPLSQLTQGYKKSCGCLGKPRIKDYTGKRFGQLTVIGYAGKKDGAHRWECRCDCGKLTVVGQTRLQSGKTKSCGCLGHPPVQNLRGYQFGDLTAIEFAEKRNGQFFWRCRCKCGKESVVRQNYLLIGKTKSCGCLQAKVVVDNMKFVDGTSVTLLEKAGKRLVSTNTSGHNGVYWNKKSQKWIAQIGFKGKTYYLGTYSKIDDAIKAREQAEDRIYGEFLDWYYETHSAGGSDP